MPPLVREVTGVLKLEDLDDGSPSSYDRRNAFENSKLLGINLFFDPLTSEMSTQLPSTSDLEASFTALARSWQSEKEMAHSPL